MVGSVIGPQSFWVVGGGDVSEGQEESRGRESEREELMI